MLESQFKKWVRTEWEKAGGWIESYEPRRGTGVGIADIQVLVGSWLIPIELKACDLKAGILWIKEEIKGDQIGWHKRLNNYAYPSYFLFGCGSDKKPEHIFISPLSREVINWRKGIDVYELKKLNVEVFAKQLYQHILRER